MLTPNSKERQDHRKEPAIMHQVMFYDGAQRNRRKIREHGDNDDCADQQPHKERTMGRERATGYRNLFLRRKASGGGKNRNDKKKTADQLRDSQRQVVPRRVTGDSGKGAPVVPRT